MSAFLVSTTHIDAMVTAGLVLGRTYGPLIWFDGDPSELPAMDHEGYQAMRRELTYSTADDVASMLYAANWRSINYRYPDTIDDPFNAPGPIGAALPMQYTFRKLAGTPHVPDVLTLISCYEYQTCEFPEWRRSEAFAFCQALRLACCDLISKDSAVQWDLDDRSIWTKRALAS